jgi:long-chain acyl-CoA synthetase
MLIAGATNTAQALGLQPGRRFLGAVPFYHANGFSNCMLLPLANGATVVLMRRFTPGGLVDLLQREAIQVLIGSPAMFSLLVDHCPLSLGFSGIETCLSSGAPMPPELITLCESRLGLGVRQLYGSTETGTVSIQPADERGGAGDVGRPLPSVEVRIVHEDGRELPPGEIGEVLVKAPTAMRGYLGEPPFEPRAVPAGFVPTGDLGRLDERGHLVMAGRHRRVVNVSGIKVDPTEVENVLREIPEVRACRVLAANDHRHLEIVKAIIAVASGASLSRPQVVGHCRKHLAEYKIPRVIEFVEAIPADETGKGPVAWEV